MIRSFCLEQQVTQIWSDEEISETDSDEVDSDVEFHLYSQVHYSTCEFSNVHKIDTPDLSMQSQRWSSLNKLATEENVPLGINSDGLLLDITTVKHPKVSNSPSFNKDDIALLRQYLDDEEADFVPEKWEIVDSVTDEDSDDAGLDIHVTEQTDTKGGDSLAYISDETREEDWRIDDRDRIKLDGTNRYYVAETGGSRLRCRNCNNTGHKARNCPEEKSLPVCFMCGDRGHVGRDCPERRNHRFVNRRVECNRCGQGGHMRAECPDLWRQFHATTEPGSIQIPHIPVKLNKNIQCYNCAEKDHFGHECDEDRVQMYCALQKPLVHRYDRHAIAEVPKDLRKKLNKKRSVQEAMIDHHKPKRSNTRIIFRSPSPPLRREKSNKRKMDYDNPSPSKSKSYLPEKKMKRENAIGQERRKERRDRSERQDRSKNYHHSSRHPTERSVPVYARNFHSEPKNKRKNDRIVTAKQEFSQSSRGFRRRHF